jgi:hypothetical protein
MTAKRNLRNAGGHFVIFLIGNLAIGPLVIVTLMRNEIADDLNVKVLQISLLYGLYFLIVGFGGRYLEPKLTFFPLKAKFVIAASSLAMGTFGCSYAKDSVVLISVFIIFVAFIGGIPFLTPLASFAVGRLSERPALGLAVATLGQLTGFGAWRSALSAMDILHDWRRAFMTCGYALLVLLLPLILLFNWQTAEPIAINKITATKRIPWGFIYLSGAGYGFAAFCGTTIITALPYLEIPAGVYIFSVSAIVGRLALSCMFDCGWKISIIGLSAMFLFISTTMVCFSGSELAIVSILGIMLFGLSYGGFLPPTLVYLRYVFPHRKADASSLLFYFGTLGVGAGSVISGVLAAQVSGIIAPLAACTAFVAMICTTAFLAYSAR